MIQLIKLGMQFEHKVSVALEDINVAMTRIFLGIKFSDSPKKRGKYCHF
jgi:hypothetical protein